MKNIEVTLHRDGSLTVNGTTFSANSNEAIDFRSASSTRKQNTIVKNILSNLAGQ